VFWAEREDAVRAVMDRRESERWQPDGHERLEDLLDLSSKRKAWRLWIAGGS